MLISCTVSDKRLTLRENAEVFFVLQLIVNVSSGAPRPRIAGLARQPGSERTRPGEKKHVLSRAQPTRAERERARQGAEDFRHARTGPCSLTLNRVVLPCP